MNGFACIDILFVGTNGDITVGEYFFDGVIGFFGIAEVVDQASTEDPVAVVECVDTDTRDVGIDAAGFGHEFVASGVDFLAACTKAWKLGKIWSVPVSWNTER